MKGNYLISDVFLDANANFSIVKQPLNLHVYFQYLLTLNIPASLAAL